MTKTRNPRKVAVVGTAPSTYHKAPFGDAAWEIRGVGPGLFRQLPKVRITRFYEIHEPNAIHADAYRGYPTYWDDLAVWEGGTVAVFSDQVQARSIHRIPHEAILEKYGPHFLTSSMAWMLAEMMFELHEGDLVGLWGIDAGIDTEYAYQRPGILHFLDLLQLMNGVQVVLPPECDLLSSPPPYPADTDTVFRIRKRGEAIKAGLAHAEDQVRQHELMRARLEGARDEHQRFSRMLVPNGE